MHLLSCESERLDARNVVHFGAFDELHRDHMLVRKVLRSFSRALTPVCTL
jgi:hypothetical protein